jgi:hypothetical protein
MPFPKRFFIIIQLISLSCLNSSMMARTPSMPSTGATLNETVKTQAIPAFEDFVDSVRNMKADAIVGVYVTNVLALTVQQQPDGDPAYVSSTPDAVTQFDQAAKRNVIGLLAHNYAAGDYFFDLQPGQRVRIILGNGSSQTYIISEIMRFQALEPTSPSIQFIDLGTDEIQSVGEVFNLVYGGEHHLTFQTCIAKDGISSWGRLFVIAVPLISQSEEYIPISIGFGQKGVGDGIWSGGELRPVNRGLSFVM